MSYANATVRVDLLIGAELALAGLTADFLRRGPGAFEQHPFFVLTMDEGLGQQPSCMSVKLVCLDPQQPSSLGSGSDLQQSLWLEDDGTCFFAWQQPAGSLRAGDGAKVLEQHSFVVGIDCVEQQSDLRGDSREGAGAELDAPVALQQSIGFF